MAHLGRPKPSHRGGVTNIPLPRKARPRQGFHSEVVAGLGIDGSAHKVALEAVHLARELDVAVRFVQILPEELQPGDRAEAETAMFEAALKALRGRPRVHATFETPSRDAREVLIARARGAAGLVVAADRPSALDEPALVAAYCAARARCPIHVVESSSSRAIGPYTDDVNGPIVGRTTNNAPSTESHEGRRR